MKKLSVLIILVFAGIFSLSAQERMKFMGKSMDCTPKQMQAHLQSKGYKYELEMENGIALSGTFQGYIGCNLLIRQDYGIISWCRVALPQKSIIASWSELYSQFVDMTDRLSVKYGKPETETYFDKDYDSFGGELDDYDKIRLVEKGKCHYYASFEVGTYGLIIVAIHESKCVFVDYYDLENQQKVKQKQDDEL